MRERGDGELQTIVVIVMLLLVYITFPGVVRGFFAWSMQEFYDAFNAGPAPIERPVETPPKPTKRPLDEDNPNKKTPAKEDPSKK